MAKSIISKIGMKMVERADKNTDKKNYTLHIVGTIIIVALAITALLYWFPLD